MPSGTVTGVSLIVRWIIISQLLPNDLQGARWSTTSPCTMSRFLFPVRSPSVIAAQAALRLAHGERFAPRLFHFVEVVAAAFDRNQRQLFARFVRRLGVGIEERVDFVQLAPESVLFAGQVLVDPHRRSLAGRHGLHHRRRTAHRVAAGENPLCGRLTGDGIHEDEPVAARVHGDFVEEFLGVQLLADGHQDLVGGNDERFAALLGTAAAGAVELAQPHRLAADAGHGTAFGDNRFRERSAVAA